MWSPFRRTQPRDPELTWEDVLVQMRGTVEWAKWESKWRCHVDAGSNLSSVNVTINGYGKRPSDAVYDAYDHYKRLGLGAA